ncbi:MAG: hypothetical protein ACE5H4_14655 [Candidatus Thorarchaeota archaeon]
MIEEEPLARLIRLRRYEELDNVVDQLLQESGWPQVASQLENIPTPHAQSAGPLDILSPTHFDMPGEPPHYITEQVLVDRPWYLSNEDVGWGVRRGTLRDGIVHILGLQTVLGIDLDSLKPFEGIQASSLDELRQSAIPVAIDFLRSQAADHRTFFLDVDAMSVSPFAAAVSDIVEARKREVRALSEESQTNEVVGTYYGFKVLTEGSIQNTRPVGFASSALEALDEMIQALGKQTRLSHTRFKSWRRDTSSWLKAWEGYDDLTQTLLKAIMLVSIGGRKRGIPEGLRVMGVLGDSRALPTLHRLLELIPVRSDRLQMLLEAIGCVGHPSSFDYILPLAKKNTVAGREALAQMPLIRSPKSTEHLLKVLAEVTWRQQSIVATRLWMTFDSRSEEVVRALWNRVSVTNDHRWYRERIMEFVRARQAVTSLALIGEEGRTVVRKHPDVVASLIERLPYTLDKMRMLVLLRAVEGLLDHPTIAAICEDVSIERR